MFAEIDAAICALIEQDGRLSEGLDSVPLVVNSLPYPREDAEFQVWIYEGRTAGLEFSYREGESPQAGTQEGTTSYTILCRVRALDAIATLYARVKQLKFNVYRILRDVPTGPGDESPWNLEEWGQARIVGLGAPYGRGKPGATASAAEQEIVFGVEWEDQFEVGT